MSKHDLEVREAIEEAAAHQAERMKRRFRSECPGRAAQPRMAFVCRIPSWQRIAGMQVERHIEALYLLPERQIDRVVVVADGVRIPDLRKPVHVRPFEAELRDGA